MGSKLGTIYARAGHEVIFSYSRSPEKLKQLARNAGGKAKAGTPREAAEYSDVILLAVVNGKQKYPGNGKQFYPPMVNSFTHRW